MTYFVFLTFETSCLVWSLYTYITAVRLSLITRQATRNVKIIKTCDLIWLQKIWLVTWFDLRKFDLWLDLTWEKLLLTWLDMRKYDLWLDLRKNTCLQLWKFKVASVCNYDKKCIHVSAKGKRCANNCHQFLRRHRFESILQREYE